jgi:hypothetical protein
MQERKPTHTKLSHNFGCAFIKDWYGKFCMPAVSQKQQKAAAIALAAKRGEFPKKKLKGSSKQMYKSMDVYELRGFAKTKRAKLPIDVDEEK